MSKSVMDNINETPTFYKGVKLFDGYTKDQDPIVKTGLSFMSLLMSVMSTLSIRTSL